MGTRLLAACVVMVSLMCGCSQPQAVDAPRETDAAKEGGAPVLVEYFDAGMADPGSRSSGIRLAVWKDGTALVGIDPSHPERDVRVGKLSPSQSDAAWAALQRAGFFSHPDTVLIAPDSAYVRITAKSGDRERTHALDSFASSQEAWWPAVIDAIRQFRPVELRPVAEVATNGEFRGFVVSEWWKTPWVR